MKVGWHNRRFGDVIELISGQHIDAKDYNTARLGVGYLTGPSDFGDETPIVSKWTENPKRFARRGDILLTVKGSGVGKSNLLDIDEVAISRQIMAVRPIGLNPQYAFLLVRSLQDHFQSLSNGAAIPGISRGDVTDLVISLPPPEEQKRIVAVLNEAFEGLARARKNAEANLRNAQELFESGVDKLLSDSRSKWSKGRFSEVVGQVFTGPFGSLLHKSDYVEGGTPIVNPANIVGEIIEPNWTKTVDGPTFARLATYALNANDIVIGRRGEMGRCAVVSTNQAGWLCGTGSFFVRTRSDVAPGFVAHLLRTPTIVRRLESLATGATMLNLSNVAMAEMEIEIPDRLEQESLLGQIEELRDKTHAIGEVYETKVLSLSDVRRSLLQKAFAGELT